MTINKAIRIASIVLPLALLSQIDSTTYYPLQVGDWREYSIYAHGGMVQGLVREGVTDALNINDHLYYRQFIYSPIEATYVRNDSSGNVLHLNLSSQSEDTLCIFDWNIAPNEREWIARTEQDGESSAFGQLRYDYYSVGVPPLGINDLWAKKLDYRWDNFLFWSGIYSSGIGEVYYMAEGLGKFIEKVKVGGELLSGSYTMDAIDTVTFTSSQIDFSNMASGIRFDFDFSFNPADQGWSSCTIGAVQFMVSPRSELYMIRASISGGGISPSEFFIQSIAIDSSRYIDCLDGRYIEAISVFSDPVNISGTFRADTLHSIPGVSEPGVMELMEVDSFEVSLIVTSMTLGIHDEEDQITNFILHDAYPNPFNPITTIEYQIPERSHVSITIYDIHGRNINTLVYEPQQAGQHETMWNGRNAYGEDVPAGMYFAKLMVSDYSQVIKMLYLR